VIKCDYANIPVFLCNTRIFVRFLLDSLSEIVYINHNEQMFITAGQEIIRRKEECKQPVP